MDIETYTKSVKDLSDKADQAIEAYEKVAKDARSESVQLNLNHRKNRIVEVLSNNLDALDSEFFGLEV